MATFRLYANLSHKPGEAHAIFKKVRQHGGAVLEFDGMSNAIACATASARVHVPDAHAEAFATSWQKEYPDGRPYYHDCVSDPGRRHGFATHRINVLGPSNFSSMGALGVLSSLGHNAVSVWHKHFIDPIGPFGTFEKLVVYVSITEAHALDLKNELEHALSGEHSFLSMHSMDAITGTSGVSACHTTKLRLHPNGDSLRSFIIPAWNRSGLALEVHRLAMNHSCSIRQLDGMKRSHGTATIIAVVSGKSANLDDLFEDVVGHYPHGENPVTRFHAETPANLYRTNDASHLLTVAGSHPDILRATLKHVATDLSLDISRLWATRPLVNGGHHLVNAFFDNFELNIARYHLLAHRVRAWASHHGHLAHFLPLEVPPSGFAASTALPREHRDAA